MFHLGVAFSSSTWNVRYVDRGHIDVDEGVLLADPRSHADPRSDAVVCVSRLSLSLLDRVQFVAFVAVAGIRHGVIVADADAVFHDYHC